MQRTTKELIEVKPCIRRSCLSRKRMLNLEDDMVDPTKITTDLSAFRADLPFHLLETQKQTTKFFSDLNDLTSKTLRGIFKLNCCSLARIRHPKPFFCRSRARSRAPPLAAIAGNCTKRAIGLLRRRAP